MRWEEALEALTAAAGQLDSLKTRWGDFTEACITEDPRGFFSKVRWPWFLSLLLYRVVDWCCFFSISRCDFMPKRV